MDKIDEWMNRAFEDPSSSDPQKNNNQASVNMQKPPFSSNSGGKAKSMPFKKEPNSNNRNMQNFQTGSAGPLPVKIRRDQAPHQYGRASKPGQSNQSRGFGRSNTPNNRPGSAKSSQPQGSSQPLRSNNDQPNQSRGTHQSSQSAHPKVPRQPNRPNTPSDPSRPNRLARPANQSGGYSQGRNRPIQASKRPKSSQLPLSKQPQTPIIKGKLKIIPLGGLNEVGKNMMAIEYEDDIIILDMGLEFPSEDMLGIDYVIPDVTYLEQNKKRIRGVFITHGHLDHIGGIPYILPKLDFPPTYATKLTVGMIQKRGEEFKHDKLMQLRVVKAGESIRAGCFTVTFVQVTHSIPDSTALVVDTPVGKIVDTGDFKFDDTPARPEDQADIPRLEQLGRENVLALFCESTNALKPGHSMSEKDVGAVLEGIIKDIPGRIIIAAFSSQIGRMQQIIDAAVKHERKIFISGRSMMTNLEIASRLGYIKVKMGQLKDIKSCKNVPDHETLILTTGSQGESVSALSRMADNEHANIKVKKGDTIVLSSSPIIGNEKAINTVINKLTIIGADVIHNQLMDVHTSGHGKQDELVQMINYIKPKYLIPIHGEYYMRQGLAKLAQQKCSIPAERILMLQNGDVLMADNGQVYKSSETVETKYILIDGTGEGKVGSQVQFDREVMSQNGAVIVLIYVSRKGGKIRRDPDVITRGFIYMHESEEITQQIIALAANAYRNINEKNPGANRKDIKKYIKQTIDKFTHSTLERRPLVVPLIIE